MPPVTLKKIHTLTAMAVPNEAAIYISEKGNRGASGFPGELFSMAAWVPMKAMSKNMKVPQNSPKTMTSSLRIPSRGEEKPRMLSILSLWYASIWAG